MSILLSAPASACTVLNSDCKEQASKNDLSSDFQHQVKMQQHADHSGDWGEELLEPYSQAPLPPITLADVMDCFRLYFGSNVTVFPFYAARLGFVGIIVVVCSAIGINLLTQSSLHRARLNLAVLELRRRVSSHLGHDHGHLGSPHSLSGVSSTTGAAAADATFVLSIGMDKKNAGENNGEIDACALGVGKGIHYALVSTTAEAALLRMAHVSATAEKANGALHSSPSLSPSIATCPSPSSSLGMKTAALHQHSSDAHAHGDFLCTPASSSNASQISSWRGVGGEGQANTQQLMVGYAIKGLGSLAKLGNSLWPDHWLRRGITLCVVIAQFFGSCGFVMLLANNVAPVLGISDSFAVYLAAAAMALLTMDTSSRTKTILAYCNNLFILGGACLLLYASLLHEKTEEERVMELQIFPKSLSEFAMYAPSVIGYVAPQLVTIDAETVLAERVYKLNFGEDPSTDTTGKSNNSSIPMYPLGVGAASSDATATQLSHLSAPGISTGKDIAVAEIKDGYNNMYLKSEAMGHSSTYAASLTKGLGTAVVLQRCFRRALFVGAALSVVVLLVVAELIMWCFRDNTKAVIALSFPESALRMAILLSLCVGLYACGALNVSPICDLMDSAAANLRAMANLHVLLQRFASRAALFGLVIAFLYLVPFFDLVAALSSAISTPLYVFFIPALCELQSEMHKAAERKGVNREGIRGSGASTTETAISQSASHSNTPADSPTTTTTTASTASSSQTSGSPYMNTGGPPLSYTAPPIAFFKQEDLSVIDGWRAMPFTSKLIAVVSVSLGSLIMSFSTITVIAETLRRRSEQQ